jgi:Holliday junction resolvase
MQGSRKRLARGISDERSLVKLLWNRGFAVMRAPASGSSTKMPRPDIIAGSSNRNLQFAIEVKTTHKEVLYMARESINQLIEFAERFGCQPIVALRFKNRLKSWIFIQPQQLMITPAQNYKTTYLEAQRIGIDFKTLIGEGKQLKLAP